MANDQIARRDQGAQASATPNVPALDFSKIDPAIMARAAAIAAKVMASNGQINAAQALAAAYHFEQTGEVMGRHAYVGTTGQVAGQVLEGYRGVARALDMSQFQFRYRPLTEDEKRMHDIDPKWQAVACEIDVLRARAKCIRMHIEYYPVVGIGILKPSDKTTSSGQPKDPPKTKTWYWVLQKRSRMDGMRQLGENTTGDDVLEEADVEAPEGSHLTIEQAEAFVREHLRKLNAPEHTPEETKKLLTENVVAMRGDPQDDPFNDSPPPTDDDDQSTENERQDNEQPVVRPSSNSNGVPNCPTCGGEMWDNHERKASGQMKANAPDYKCKNKECEGKYWPGQWPTHDKPSDDQLGTLAGLVQILYPKREDKTKFKGWFANVFPAIDTSDVKTVPDLLNKLTSVEAETCIGTLRDMKNVIAELKDSDQAA